ncbi:MAG TPA: MFS transporter [Verrucomicrobiae bacterium]|nr:MFS transporter [Verrucomicrobiae bacterium]
MTQLSILYLVSLLMDMSVSAVIFAISRRAAELGASASDLGWLGAVWIGVYAALALVMGRVSDRVGRRKLAVIGCIITALMALACSFTTQLGPLLALSGLFGAGLSCYWPSIIAWLGEGVAGHALAKRLTTFGVAWNIGLLIGYYGSGVLFEHGSRLPFYFSTGSISLIALLLLLPTRPTDPASASLPIEENILIPQGRGFRKTAWLANFATNFSLGGTMALFPQLATHLGISADIHGGLVSAGRAAALAAFAAMQFLMFWRSRLWPLWIAQLCCAASIVWIGLAHATWMFAAAWIIGGAVSGYTYQASIYFTLEEMMEKGKGSGFHEAILGGGMCFGPLLAGWVGNSHGLRFPYFFCAVVQIAIVALQMMVAWTQRRLSAMT